MLKETDEIRGDVSRSTYIRHALEEYGHHMIPNGKWIKGFLQMIKEEAELKLEAIEVGSWDKDPKREHNTIKMAEDILRIIGKLGDKKTIPLTNQLAWDLFFKLESKRKKLEDEDHKDERKYYQDQLRILDYYMDILDIYPGNINWDLPVMEMFEEGVQKLRQLKIEQIAEG